MSKKVVVHTGIGPHDPCVEESKALDAPDIAFVKRGKCRTPQEVLEAICDADVALCMGEPYPREVLARAPRLKAVIRYGVGVDTIDLDAATEHGIMVGYFPDFCIREVANHAIVFVLACAKKILRLDRAVRTRGWGAGRDLRQPMGAIHDETLGLLAFGNIAREVARLAHALGMQVLAYDPFVDPTVFREAGVESVSLQDLARRSDYVSCHIPLNDHTRHMIDGAFFAQMKPTAYFVNTSRGPVVQERDLVVALQQGQIAGAALDVFETEPMAPDHPFLSMENVILTPHTASYADATFAARDRRVGIAAVTIARGGIPEFVANPQVLGHRRT